MAIRFPKDPLWSEMFGPWINEYKAEGSSAGGWPLRWLEGHLKHHPQSLAGWVENREISSIILFQKSPELVDIHFLWTPLKYRRQGHMHKLLRSFVEHFHDCRIWLEVSEANTPAIALYRGLGFSSVGTRKSYYSSKERAHLFSL